MHLALTQNADFCPSEGPPCVCWLEFGKVTAHGSSQVLGSGVHAAPLGTVLIGILLSSSWGPGGLEPLLPRAVTIPMVLP